MSDSLRPHESQHARPPCPSLTPGVHSDSRPSSQWCHPAISSSVVPFSSCPQSLPASESFPMSQLFTWGGQSTGFSFSIIPSKEIPGLISFRMDRLDLLAVQETLKSLLQHHSSNTWTSGFWSIVILYYIGFIFPKPGFKLCSINASGKESSYQCRRHKRCRFHPWIGKISWSRKPSPVFLPGKSHGQRSLAVGSQSWTWLSMRAHLCNKAHRLYLFHSLNFIFTYIHSHEDKFCFIWNVGLKWMNGTYSMMFALFQCMALGLSIIVREESFRNFQNDARETVFFFLRFGE